MTIQCLLKQKILFCWFFDIFSICTLGRPVSQKISILIVVSSDCLTNKPISLPFDTPLGEEYAHKCACVCLVLSWQLFMILDLCHNKIWINLNLYGKQKEVLPLLTALYSVQGGIESPSIRVKKYPRGNVLGTGTCFYQCPVCVKQYTQRFILLKQFKQRFILFDTDLASIEISACGSWKEF